MIEMIAILLGLWAAVVLVLLYAVLRTVLEIRASMAPNELDVWRAERDRLA